MTYPSNIQELIESAPASEPGPGLENTVSLAALNGVSIESFGTGVVHTDMAACCISGLWLRHNFLDRSHTISQDIGSAEGSYWHGIMHRREPDYSNSKYWFRRVGKHAIHGPLAEHLCADVSLTKEIEMFDLIDGEQFDPYNFVDACQAVASSGDADATAALQKIAAIEWQLLFDHCFRQAFLS